MKKTALLLISLFIFGQLNAQFVTIPDTSFVSWLNANGLSGALSGNQLDTTNVTVNSLQSLNINSSTLTNLSGIKYFKSLKRITISCNRLTTIPGGFSSGLKKLTLKPGNLPLNSFTFPNLDTFIFSSNNISTNYILPISLPNSLSYLDIYDDNPGWINLIPLNIANLTLAFNSGSSINLTADTLLKSLKIDACDFTSVSLPNNIQNLTIQKCYQLSSLSSLPTQLINLDISYNAISTIAGSFPANIIKINISHNNLSNIPSTLPPNLHEFDASYNNLSYLNYQIFPTSIQKIYLNNNQFTGSPNFNNLISLYSLDISNNHYSIYSLDLTSCINLQFFGASSCQDTNSYWSDLYLPASIKNVYVNNNKLNYVNFSNSSSPYSYESIYVDLSHNKIQGINWGGLFEGTSNYIYVNASYNKLYYTGLNANWGSLVSSYPLSSNGSNDIYLNLSHNNYSGTFTCPTGFFYPKQLDLSYNKITTYSELQTVFTKTHYLNLQHNQLTNLIYNYNLNYNTLSSIDVSYNQLTNIPSEFNCDIVRASYNNLQSINFCPNSPYAQLYLDNNPNLMCLPKLLSLDTLSFVNTGVTCVTNYGSVSKSAPKLNTIPLCTWNYNPNNCVLLSNISGNTYISKAGIGCTKSYLDPPLMYAGVNIFQGGQFIEKVFSNQFGDYNFAVPPGSYTLKVDTNQMAYNPLCPIPSQIPITVNINTSSINNNFAFKCKPGFDIGNYSIEKYDDFFPGEDNLTYFQIGDLAAINRMTCATQNLAGTITINFTGPISYIGMAGGFTQPNVIGTNSISWNITDFSLIPVFNRFKIKFHTWAVAQAGDQITFNVIVTPTANDILPSNNNVSKTYKVVNSHDPNYKEVYPTTINTIPYTDWLTYTIHFQNTGTAPAHNIVLRDTLDSYLDPATLQYICSSHTCELKVDTNFIALFKFPNINLADSISDEANSHGWVQYRIKLKNNIPIGAVINNNASIYFDFNPPVVTNTVSIKNCITKCTNISKKGCSANYLFNGKLITQSGTYIDTLISATGCDSIVTLNYVNDKVVNPQTAYANFCQGIHYAWNGKTYTKSGVYYDTLAAYNGCDSINMLNIVFTPITTKINSLFCPGTSHYFNGKFLTKAGLYYDTIKTSSGCDSIIELNLTSVVHNAHLPGVKTFFMCNLSPITVFGKTYTMPGNYFDTILCLAGCKDSIVNVKILNNYFNTSNALLTTNSGYYCPNSYSYLPPYIWIDCSTKRILDTTYIPYYYPSYINKNIAVILQNSYGCIDTSNCVSSPPLDNSLCQHKLFETDTLFFSAYYNNNLHSFLNYGIETKDSTYLLLGHGNYYNQYSGQFIKAGLYAKYDHKGKMLNSGTIGINLPQFRYPHDAISLNNGKYLVGLDDSTGNSDYYLYSINGNTTNFESSFASAGDDKLMSMLEINPNQFILAGHSNGGISGTKTSPSLGGYDFWVIAIDSMYNILWQKSFGTVGNDYVSAISLGPNNTILVGGNSDNTSNNNLEILLYQLDLSGNLLNTTSFNGPNNERLSAIKMDQKKRIILGGTTNSTSINNINLVNYSIYYNYLNGPDYLCCILDSNLNTTNILNYGSAYSDILTSISIRPNGNYLLYGHSNSDMNQTKSQGPFGNGNGMSDYWLIEINTTGKIIGQKIFGGNQNESAGKCFSRNTNNIILTGTSLSGRNGNKNVNNLQGFAGQYFINLEEGTKSIVHKNICNGQPVNFHGNIFPYKGIYLDTIATYIGCDSIVTLIIDSCSNTSDTLNITRCQNDPILFHHQLIQSSGTYYDTLRNHHLCDSIIILHLNIIPISVHVDSITTCGNQPVVFNGIPRNKSGVYYDTLQNYLGCDSISILALTVNPIQYDTLPILVCSNNGNSYTYNGHVLTQSTIFNDTLTSYKGCDSILTLNIHLNTAKWNNYTVNSCLNHPYFFNGQLLTSSGTYKDTLQSYNGCDSFVTLNLLVAPTSHTNISATICQGSYYLFKYRKRKTSGTYYDTLTNYLGCDSVIQLNLNVIPKTYSSIYATICYNRTYLFHNKHLSKSGIYYDTLLNYHGCDSIISVHLIVRNKITTSLTKGLCSPNYGFIFSGQNLTIPGVYYDTLTSYLGCDSFITLNLQSAPNNTLNVTTSICSNYPYNLYGNLIDTSGIYYDSTINSLGCYEYTHLNLTSTPASFTTLSKATCHGNTIVFNNHSLNSSGTYYDTLTNYHGCDSLITLNFTMYPLYDSVFTHYLCNGESFYFNNHLLSVSGIYHDTLLSTTGCDSFVTLNLLYAPNSETYLNTQSICQGSSYNLNGTLINQSGTYVDTISNIYGCDSIIHVTLNFIPIDTAVIRMGDTLQAQQLNGTNIWIDCNTNNIASIGSIFIPQNSGSYALVVSANNCMDTSVCYTIILKTDYVNGLLETQSIRIFPNPTEGQVNVQSSKQIIQKINLYDGTGRLVKPFKNINTLNASIDMSPYAQGMYWLEIQTVQSVKRLKIVKE